MLWKVIVSGPEGAQERIYEDIEAPNAESAEEQAVSIWYEETGMLLLRMAITAHAELQGAEA